MVVSVLIAVGMKVAGY
ncbi:hypothetical protein [Serratia ureilytica]